MKFVLIFLFALMVNTCFSLKCPVCRDQECVGDVMRECKSTVPEFPKRLVADQDFVCISVAYIEDGSSHILNDCGIGSEESICSSFYNLHGKENVNCKITHSEASQQLHQSILHLANKGLTESSKAPFEDETDSTSDETDSTSDGSTSSSSPDETSTSSSPSSSSSSTDQDSTSSSASTGSSSSSSTDQDSTSSSASTGSSSSSPTGGSSSLSPSTTPKPSGALNIHQTYSFALLFMVLSCYLIN